MTQRVSSDQLADLFGIAETTKSDYAQLVDVLVLKHVCSSGSVEEYLVPRHSCLFGNDAAGKGWVDMASLRSGDMIRLQNLQLVRDIQQGQNEVIRATADEILSDNQPNRSFRRLEEAKRRMTNAILEKTLGLPRF